MTYDFREDVFNQLAPPYNPIKKSGHFLCVTGLSPWHRVASVGASSLILQDKTCKALWMAVDADIQVVEKSIMDLQDSLSSLAEEVVKIRRGLDLLFLQQGEICTP